MSRNPRSSPYTHHPLPAHSPNDPHKDKHGSYTLHLFAQWRQHSCMLLFIAIAFHVPNPYRRRRRLTLLGSLLPLAILCHTLLPLSPHPK